MDDLGDIVGSIAAQMSAEADRGRVADYIPALARVSPDHFGIAVVTADGTLHAAGDAQLPFSVQSVSKVFALTLALDRVGDDLWKRVGREPSGSAFNSIVQLESERGIPRNPFINAGAIVVSDALLAGQHAREAIGDLLRFVRFLADDDGVTIDSEVAHSEAGTGFRNFALANYMKAFGNLDNAVEEACKVYFHQCALTMSCCQLAMAGRFLMADGVHPGTGRPVITPERARRINALMLTCGHYDGSGEFAFRVGIPGKSGVGGGILAIVPGKASIAVWSPGLNERGNSKLGSLALEKLAERTGWSVFTA
ncbi:glutaminase [Sphingomonas sp. MAH-20]|uniref:Glutaminase n=1 Tax=Sphingomonas horti TaxID=2682842 RepID=A0A6I4J136_9SPHN|nr:MULTISPECIES: glutaminase [Sphingomonas]MBA2919806.1 glutaminase [Sphingomonas sp. CGMCC 1.13658]MVO78047.1 glutaminase [Sphingomonas horti]